MPYFGLSLSFLLLAAWLEPNHYLPWVVFRNDWLAWLCLPVLALCFSRVREGAVHVPYVAKVLLVLSVVPFAQFLGGIVFFLGDAVLASLNLLGLAFVIIVSSALPRRHLVLTLAMTILAGALLSSFLALGQWLSVEMIGWLAVSFPPGARPYANLAQPNLLASLLLMGVASAVYLRQQRLYSVSVAILIGFVLFAGVAATRSRMGLLVGAVFLSFLWLRGKTILPRTDRRVLLPPFAIMLFGMWLFWPSLSDLIQVNTTGSLERISQISSDARLGIWRLLLSAVQEKPLFGWGWGQVSVAQHAVAASFPYAPLTEYAHNIVLDLIIWNGGVIGGAFVIFAFWWCFRQYANLRSGEALFAGGVILVLLMHALLEFPLSYAFFLVPFGICVGILESYSPSRSQLSIRPREFGICLALMSGSILLYVGYEYLQIEEDHRRLRYEAAGYARPVPGHKAPDVMLLTQQGAFLRFARTEAKPDMTSEELDAMRLVASRYGYPPVLFRYALALGLNGRTQEAELELTRLRALHPPDRYQEALDGWAEAQKRFPSLNSGRQLPSMESLR